VDATLAALADGATVVTANNRLARSVTLAFNRSQADAGLVAWRSPAVLAWGEWLEDLWADVVAAGGPAGGRTLLGDFQARLLWAEVIAADPPPAEGAVATTTVAEEAAAAWRLCARWRLTPEDLAAAADSRDTQLFARWAARYRDRRDALGATDAEHVATLLATEIGAGHLALPSRLHFAGFEEWSPLQREFLRVVAGAGCRVTEGGPPAAAHAGAVRVRVHDRTAELELAARWARALVAGGARSVAIVVPDLAGRRAGVRRAVLEVVKPGWQLAPGDELPVNVSLAGPLADTGLATAALLLLRALRGGLDWRDAGVLLRSPYLAGAASESGARARLDLALRDRLGTDVPLAGLVADAAPGAPLLAARLGALQALARALPRRQGAAAWADSFRAALDAAGWPGDRALATDEFQALEAWGRLWDELRRCDGLAGALELPGAIGLVARLAAERVFQPAGHPDGIQVLGTLEAVGQSFDALWIVGLTSDAWPPAVRPHPLVPLGLQRRLGMPGSTPPLARERAVRILRWLEAGAGQVVLSTPAFDGDEPLAASPLVERLPEVAPEALAAWRAPLAADVVAASGRMVPLDHDPPVPAPAGRVYRGGVGLLQATARCPARAFLEYRLGARELEAPVTGISALARGIVTHRVLEGFARRVRDHESLAAVEPPAEVALLDELIAEALAHEFPRPDRVLARLLANEHERQRRVVGEFLALERERPGYRVIGVEEEARVHGALPDAVAALGIRVRPDRVDELPDGRLLVVDYKTGARLPGLTELWGPRPRSPQLPVYAMALGAEGIAFAQVSAAGARWCGIGRKEWDIRGIDDPERVTRTAVPGWATLRASWWTALERIATDFLQGRFVIDRWRRDEASGQWALATRVHELADEAGDAGTDGENREEAT